MTLVLGQGGRVFEKPPARWPPGSRPTATGWSPGSAAIAVLAAPCRASSARYGAKSMSGRRQSRPPRHDPGQSRAIVGRERGSGKDRPGLVTGCRHDRCLQIEPGQIRWDHLPRQIALNVKVGALQVNWFTTIPDQSADRGRARSIRRSFGLARVSGSG
jgi:hypothetical protein